MKKNRITAEIREAVEQLTPAQMTRFVKFLYVLEAGGTKEEAFKAAENL